jgi:hypothetical protein
LGYKAATSLRIPNDRLECLQLLIELNTGENAKTMRCNTFINDSITKVRQRAKISMLKLDMIRKRKERKTNLKYKIEQEALQKRKISYSTSSWEPSRHRYCNYVFAFAKNKREK